MGKIVTLGEIMLRLSTPGNTRFVQSDSFDFVLWQLRNKISFVTIIGTAYSDIGLTSSVDDIKAVGLDKTGVPGR